MIVCCGTALIDFLPDRNASGAPCFRPVPGGSLYNTAVALGRLGREAALLTGLSTDFFGDTLREGLAVSGVDRRFIMTGPRSSTLAFVKLERGHARYAFFDDGSAARMLTEAGLPKLPARVRALHFGDFNLAVEPCGSAFEALQAREAKRRVISLDPNIRPSMVKARRPYLARLARMARRADIVKVSDEDIAWMTGGIDTAAAARVWLRAGVPVVIVTKGAKGVDAFTRHYNFRIPAHRVKVADTVGAGDTFMAALLSALADKKLLDKTALAGIAEADLRAALGFAARAAAIACSRPGADPPWAHELS